MTGQAASTAPLTTAQAQRLAELRYTVLDAVSYSPYATAEEKQRTAASVAACHNEAVLLKWYCNVLTVLSARELAPPTAAPAPVAPLATTEQKEQIIRLLNHPAVTRRHKNRVLVGIDRLTTEEAATTIANLTAYVAAPFGAGATGRKANSPAPTAPAASFPAGLLDSRSRSHNGTFVCPTYTVLPALESARLDNLIAERLSAGQLAECQRYHGPLARPCKASAQILTVFVN